MPYAYSGVALPSPCAKEYRGIIRLICIDPKYQRVGCLHTMTTQQPTIAGTGAARGARTPSSPGRIVGAALFLGWAFDALFYGKALGVSVLLFVLGLLATLFWIGRAEGVRHAPRNLW